MKPLATYDRIYRECLVAHEIFRRLGFSSKDIYFVAAPSSTAGGSVVGMELHAQGKVYTVRAGTVSDDLDHAFSTWREIAEGTAVMPQEEFDEVWGESSRNGLLSRAPALLASIEAKGFYFPRKYS